MKQYEITEAYKAMDPLARVQGLTASEQWNLYLLRKELRKAAAFVVEREEMLQEKYKPYADSEGKLSGGKAEEYVKEINELRNVEVDTSGYPRPVIRMVDGIPFTSVEALDELVEFQAPE